MKARGLAELELLRANELGKRGELDASLADFEGLLRDMRTAWPSVPAA